MAQLRVESNPLATAQPLGNGEVVYPLDARSRDGRTLHGEYRVVPGDRLTAPQLERMIEILTAAYDGWPHHEIPVSRSEHIRWRLEGHAGESNAAYLTEVRDEIVGVSDEVRRWFRVGGERRYGRLGLNQAIDPAWQGFGLKHAAIPLNAAHHRQRFALSISVTTHRRGARRPNHYVLGNTLHAYVRVLRPQRLAAIWRRQGRAFRSRRPRRRCGRRAPREPRARLPPARGAAPPPRVRAAARFDSRVDELFEAAATELDFVAERREGFLNWRYCDPRVGPYEVLLAEEGERLAGYAVTRAERGRGFIVDLLTLPGRPEITDALVEESVGRLAASGAAGVLCWLTARHPYGHALRRHGFVDSRRDPPFLYEAEGMRPEELAFLQHRSTRVHLTPGDLDVI